MPGINTNAWNRLRYTLYAPVYDLVAGFAAQRRRSIEVLGPQPGERVLIVGAGTGADLPHLPEGVRVTAVDLTPAMVQRLERRARALGRSVDARVMDAHRLDFADGSFDAVVLHLIVAVVPDPVAALREADRVLTARGRAVVFDKFAPEGRAPSLLRRGLNLVTNALFSDVTRQLGSLLRPTALRVVQREDALFAGLFQIALLRKHPGREADPAPAEDPA